MGLIIKRGDLFTSDSPAIVLPIDGSKRGLEGNLASAFSKRFPDAWEAVAEQIQFPMGLGSADAFSTEKYDCCAQNIIVVSTLHHLSELNSADVTTVARDATRAAIEMAIIYKFERVDFPILSGGWRLPVEKSVVVMVNTYLRFSLGRKLPDARIMIKDPEIWGKVFDTVSTLDYLHLEIGNGIVEAFRK